MSYENPTPQEIRISQRLQAVTRKVHNIMNKRFEGEVDFILMVCPKRKDLPTHANLQQAPVMSYSATSDRESSAMMISELLAKWIANEDIPPLHELRDAAGRSLDEILGGTGKPN